MDKYFGKPWILTAAAAAATVTLMAGCASSGDTSSGSSSAGEFTIGFALSQSGNMAPFDMEPGNAALLRIKEINTAGGIKGKQIKTIVKDVRSDQGTVGTVATELLSQGIDLLRHSL